MNEKLTKMEWIERYGGQELLDCEGFDVVPCFASCDDPICHGWRVVKKDPNRGDPMKQITLCLVGDDRERTYPVTWFGTADFFSVGEVETALIQHQESEALVYRHPEYGWISAHDAGCRDFSPAEGYPPMTNERLEDAL